MGSAVETEPAELPEVREAGDEPQIQFPEREESLSSLGEATELGDSGAGGYCAVCVGDTFKSGRYRALCRLGCGHFSTVWLCHDIYAKRRQPLCETAESAGENSSSSEPRGCVVALKIQKSSPSYSDAARDEIKLLEAVRDQDHDGMGRTVTLLDHFDHYGAHGLHVCLVFEVMGGSLLHLIKRFNFRGIPLPLVRRLSRELLEGLDFLHNRGRVIHTDLKPENVLLEISQDTLAELDRQAAEFGRQLIARKNADALLAGSKSKGSASYGAGSTSRTYKRNQKRRAKAKAKKAAERAKSADTESVVTEESDATVVTSPSGKSSGGNDSACTSGNANDACVVGETQVSDRKPEIVNGTCHQPCDAIVQGEFIMSRIVDADAVFANGSLKVVDLGNACWVDGHSTGDIQTRQYRSPEVILGAKYDCSVDIWSAGCMIFELLTGT